MLWFLVEVPLALVRVTTLFQPEVLNDSVSEYVGELAHYYPEKKVTLVHGQAALMNDTYPDKFRKSVLDAVKKIGIEVILGDKIPTKAVPEGGYVTTEKGHHVRADLVVSTCLHKILFEDR
jgi:NADH dehydrogenase FAD-containing subunit